MDSSGSMSEGSHPRAAGAQSIGRAAAMLRLIASQPAAGATLSALVEASGLVKPTCRRILLALMDAGLVEQDPTSRRYVLGPEAYLMGLAAAVRHGSQPAALDGAARLARLTGDAAFHQVRRGYSVVCLHREDGDYPLRSHVLAAGDRHPLGVGAGGLALLAALPDHEVDSVLDANRALLAQRYRMLGPGLLRDLVAETRERGYSMNRGLLFPGSWGMGMAVRDAKGRADQCLSIAAVESRMQPDREVELAAWLAEEVARLEAALGAAAPHSVRHPPAPVSRRAGRAANSLSIERT